MRWLRNLRRQASMEDDLRRELAYHIDRRVDDLMRSGMSVEEARRAAAIEFGGVAQVQEEVRDTWLGRALQDFRRDLLYGARMLRRSPGFTAVAVLSLALGIGANTAIFTLIHAVLLESIPVRDPQRLVQITRHNGNRGFGAFSWINYERMRDGVAGLDGLLAQRHIGRRDVTVDGVVQDAAVEAVTPNYHSLLGLRPFAGRLLEPSDMHEPVAVISHRYWQTRFGSDPATVGRTLRVNNASFIIAGVTPPEFHGVQKGQSPDITVPLGLEGQVRGGRSWLNDRSVNFLEVMGRLKPGATREQVQTEASTVFSHIVAEQVSRATEDFVKAQVKDQWISVSSASAGFDNLRRAFSQPLFLLMGITALVLLLCCANLANLMLARTVSRRTELSVRLAIGAGRGRIVRQMLTESLLLSVLGGATGLILAFWLSDALVTILSNGAPRMTIDVRPDFTVLSFAVAATFASTMTFGLLPAWRAARGDVHPVMKESGSAAKNRAGELLVAAQAAISIVLLVGAVLFVRTLLNFRFLDTGFQRDGALSFGLNVSKSESSPERLRQMMMSIQARIAAIPGITAASYSLMPPVSGGAWTGSPVVEGYAYKPGEDRNIYLNEAGPGLFRALGAPVLLGREFTERDDLGAPRTAIVNEAFARYYYGGQSPLGHRLLRGREKAPIEIVGMVKDVHYESLRQTPPPTIWFAARQAEEVQNWHTWVVRTAGAPLSVRRAIEEAVRDVAPTVRVINAIELAEHVDRSILRERLMAMLGAFFGGIALLLAGLGVYGVLAFQVTRRKTEIGIRMALGARSGEIVRLMLRDTALLIGVGILAGIAVAAPLAKLAGSLLFGLTPNDPWTFGIAAAVLLGAAGMAAFLPGRRAARLDPVAAIRYE